jgi:hypothetical protein
MTTQNPSACLGLECGAGQAQLTERAYDCKKTAAMAAPATDPIASWFAAAEAIGEFIGIRFGRVSPGSTEPEWTFLPHSDYDGIGGFAEILRSRGAKIDRLPQIKYPLSPSLSCLLRTLPKYFAPRHKISWGPLPRGTAKVAKGEPPPAVAWHVFDEATTLQMRRGCRKVGVTINSFLLKNLTKAIRPFLADQSSVVPWMVPVNIRGKVDRGRDTTIHTSYVGVRVRSYETVRDIHRHIYTALGKGEHWANWQMYMLGNLIPGSVRRYLVATGLGGSQWNLGGFSNLGDWDPDKKITQPGCLGDWLFSPLVFDCLSIGAGCVTFQNRLSLTVHAHPNVTTDPAVPQAWVANWIKEIELDLTSV